MTRPLNISVCCACTLTLSVSHKRRSEIEKELFLRLDQTMITEGGKSKQKLSDELISVVDKQD